MGKAGEGAEHRPPAEEDGRGPAARHARPLRDPGQRRGPGQGALRHAQQRAEGLPGRPAQGAGRAFPARFTGSAQPGDPAARQVRRGAEAHRRPRDLHHHGLRADPDARCCATRRSASASCRSCRTRAAPSAWRGCSARSGIYNPLGQTLHPRGRRPDDVLQGSKRRPGAAGGHQRGRLDGRLDRRRHRLFEPRRADDPVLHLLLDVRLPAGRRSGLGGRRQPRARLPAGRHRRAHHAERRGAAARGRAQPHPRRHHAELHQLRPDLRLRGGGDRAARAAADVRRPGGRLLLPHPDERELRPSRDADGRRGGDHQGALPVPRRPPGRARSTST